MRLQSPRRVWSGSMGWVWATRVISQAEVGARAIISPLSIYVADRSNCAITTYVYMHVHVVFTRQPG